MPSIPLQYRLPNPPPLFKGRQRDMAHLAQAIERGPVTVVSGMGGIGKTALVHQTLHQHFPDRVGTTLQIRPDPHGEGILIDAIRALAMLQNVTPDWSTVLKDPEFSLATAIDLADEGPWWVVIEDLHQIQRAEETLEMLARYARHSRWIATSRLRPAHHLDGQILALEALEDAALAEIALAWDPNMTPETVSDRVRSAAGSPWRLTQALSGGSELDPTPIDALSDDQRQIVHRLALLRRPVPIHALGISTPNSDALAALHQRGLLIEAQGEWRIHDAARELALAAWTRSEDAVRELIAALSTKDTPPRAALESVRLALESGQDPTPLLEARAQDIVKAGHGPALSIILDRAPQNTLRLWRLSIAEQTGDAERLSKFTLSSDPSPEERLQWGKALYEMSRFAEAAEAMDALLSLPNRPAALDIQARILRANATMACGRMVEAEAELRTLEPTDDTTRRQIDELIAGLCAMLGRAEEALVIVERLKIGLPELSAEVRPWSALRLVRILYLLNRAFDASKILDQTLEEVGPRAFGLAMGRKAVEIQLAIAITLGRLDQAEQLLTRLDPFTTDAHTRARSTLQRLLIRLFQGRLDGFTEAVESAIAQAEQLNYGDAVSTCLNIKHSGAILQAVPIAEPPHPTPKTETRFFEVQLELTRAIHTMLTKGPRAAELPPADSPLLQLRALQITAHALQQLLRGQPRDALELMTPILASLEKAGLGLERSTALELICDACLCLPEGAAGLKRGIEALADLADIMGSDRFRHTAEWFGTMASLATLDPVALERLGQQQTTSPRSARRSAALLGGEAPLDCLDIRVLGALRSHPDWIPIQTRVLSKEPGVRWGVDCPGRRVWFGDGRTIGFARRARLWALLSQLAENGSATKEALVEAVWGEQNYHPLKHDNRLRLAVHRLREVCGDDGALIATTDDGYALRGTLRVRRQGA